jgi:hypothetical protein
MKAGKRGSLRDSSPIPSMRLIEGFGTTVKVGKSSEAGVAGGDGEAGNTGQSLGLSEEIRGFGRRKSMPRQGIIRL